MPLPFGVLEYETIDRIDVIGLIQQHVSRRRIHRVDQRPFLRPGNEIRIIARPFGQPVPDVSVLWGVGLLA